MIPDWYCWDDDHPILLGLDNILSCQGDPSFFRVQPNFFGKPKYGYFNGGYDERYCVDHYDFDVKVARDDFLVLTKKGFYSNALQWDWKDAHQYAIKKVRSDDWWYDYHQMFLIVKEQHHALEMTSLLGNKLTKEFPSSQIWVFYTSAADSIVHFFPKMQRKHGMSRN